MSFSVPTSCTWMMLGWFSAPAARASRMNWSTNLGRLAYFGASIFSATVRAIERWLALKTMPMPPSPSFSPTSYLLSRSFSSASPACLTKTYSTWPTRMRSPKVSCRSLMRLSLCRVPLRLPRSISDHSLPSRRMWQWARLAMPSTICTSQLL